MARAEVVHKVVEGVRARDLVRQVDALHCARDPATRGTRQGGWLVGAELAVRLLSVGG